jgi:hypothetical protein
VGVNPLPLNQASKLILLNGTIIVNKEEHKSLKNDKQIDSHKKQFKSNNERPGTNALI